MLDDKKLEELYTLTKDNNRMLRAMRREAFVGGILKLVWWVVVLIVLPYLIYVWYLEPYLSQILTAYETAQGQAGQVTETVNQLKEATSGLSWLKDLVDRFTSPAQ